MLTIEALAEGRTLAEASGMTAELGREIARLASEELRAGRLETAAEILEGLAVCNPYDAATWAVLADVERRRGRLLAARAYGEAAARLAPEDPYVRLARAEAQLALKAEVATARAELAALASDPTEVGARASALLKALG